MNARQGVNMTTAQALAYRDMFLENPMATVENILLNRKTHILLEALLADLPRGTDWLHLLRLGDALSRHNDIWFHRIIQAANRNLAQAALSDALIEYMSSSEELHSLGLVNLERAVDAGVFDPIIERLPKNVVKNLVHHCTMGDAFVRSVAAHRIQHFLDRGDLKRAFDELAQFGIALPDRRPPAFELWVNRVWREHHEKGLVTDLTDDPGDWRNCAMPIQVRFGKLRGGNTARGHKPCVDTLDTHVPILPLWGTYTLPIPDVRSYAVRWAPLKRAENAYAQDVHGKVVYFPMTPTGAMLRDMIVYWHQKAKERKLWDFCAKHNIAYPPPA